MPYQLDAVDRQIIRILQADGRTANVEVARRVGMSEATVRKRLERLVSEGVIHITAVPNPSKVGLSTVTFLTLDVELSLLERIADELGQSAHRKDFVLLQSQLVSPLVRHRHILFGSF